MACTYTIEGIERPLTESEFKEHLLNGALKEFSDNGDLIILGLEEAFKKPKIRIPVGDEGGNKGGPPNEGEEISDQEEEQPERRFTKQVLRDKNITPEAKSEIEKKLKYIKQTNAMSVQEAADIINYVGEDKAYELVVNDRNMKPAVRVVMGQALIKKFNDLAVAAINKEDREYYTDKTIETANYVTEKLATEPGQMIQAFSLYSRLTPEAQLRAAINEQKEAAEGQKKKQKKNVDKLSEKLKQANKEAAEEITSSKEVQDEIDKTEQKTKSKAQGKIEKARAKRKDIIDKFKKGGGGITFTSGGLTKEGLEFIGELAKTYIEEGLARVEDITARIYEDIKGFIKEKSPEIDADINKAVNKAFENSDKKLIGKGLKDLKADINKIVKEHYTVLEKTKEDLAKKLVEDAGLEGKDAAELSKKIQDAFDRVATRKKERILEQEKSRVDRIKKGLEGNEKKDPKTIQSEIIKYTNLGAFNNEDLLDMIAEKLGTGKLTPEQGKRITELADKIQKAPEGSPKNEATEDLLKYRADLNGKRLMEVAQGIWYANVLSGYVTHLKNIVSTFFNSAAFFSSEAIRDPKAIPFLLAGAGKGLKRGAIEAWHTITTGRSPIHVSKVETPNILERIRFWGGFLNPYNYLKFVSRLMVAEDVLQFQGLKEMRATQMAYREAKRLGLKNPFSKEVWNKVNELLLNTKDRLAEAEDKVKEEGLTGNEARRRTYELMEQSRPIQMVEDSYGFAAKGTFNHASEGSLGAITNAIGNILDIPVGGGRPLRFLVPFTRIITNVANNALDFSPVGLIRAARGKRGFESFDKFHATKGAYHEMTKEERAQVVARASLGIGLTLGLYALTKIKGDDDKPLIEITGHGPSDVKKLMQLKQTGWQPNSIKIGDNYYSYALTPLIFNLAWIGNSNDREKYDNGYDEKGFAERMGISIYDGAHMITDMTWVNSTATLMSAISQDNPNQIESEVGRSVSNMAKGFIVPNAYTQGAQRVQNIFDMPQKQVNNAWEYIIQDIPIARNSLNDKINALGDPIVRDVDLLKSTETKDPVWRFIIDKNIWIAPINKNSLIVFDPKIKQDRPATNDEYYRFSKIRGQRIRQSLDNIRLVKPDITTEQLNKVLKKIKAAATKRAKAVIALDIREDEE